MSQYTLDDIISALDANHQRATYGAVAALVDASPRSLMRGRAREQRNSWIVSNSTGAPSGYPAEEIHPDLKQRDTVLRTREELETWLAERLAMA